MRCFIQTIAFFHLIHCILQCYTSHIAVLHIAFFYLVYSNVFSDLFMMIRTVVQNGKGTV